MDLLVKSKESLDAILRVPGDKSISHRSIIIGALASGITEVENFLPGQDCLCTINCLQQLGIKVEVLSPTCLYIKGQGLGGLEEPQGCLDAGNSGTTIRLLSGVLAGQEFFSILTGDASIRRRPMARVVMPLRQMGARIWGRSGDRFAPLAIKGGQLQGIHYHTPVASAQVKSAVLLAGLLASGETAVTEPAPSRDHTEKMLQSFGAHIEVDGLTTLIKPRELKAQKVVVPGDISSAAFLLVAGAIVPGSRINIQRVGLNPTRTGIIDVLEEMGANIRISKQEEIAGEIMGDICVESSELKGVKIGGDIIPRLIDEIPALAVAAAVARGETVIRDAGELKLKESNRLRAIAAELSRFGVNIQETDDGLMIRGGRGFQGTVCDAHHDHRIAMACTVMGLVASGQTIVRGAECIDISFPGFKEVLGSL